MIWLFLRAFLTPRTHGALVYLRVVDGVALMTVTPSDRPMVERWKAAQR